MFSWAYPGFGPIISTIAQGQLGGFFLHKGRAWIDVQSRDYGL